MILAGESMRRRVFRRVIISGTAFLLLFLILSLLFVNRMLEPMLRNRLHTIIVTGSDSLYSYSLGRLDADFFGGSIFLEDLHIQADSSRYLKGKSNASLPSLTFHLDVGRAHLKGIGLLALVLGKRVSIGEIYSGDAHLSLVRHEPGAAAEMPQMPLWKAIRPEIDRIAVGRIRLRNLGMDYRSEDSGEKFRFGRFDADIRDLRIDSSAHSDPTRTGLSRQISLDFGDIEYRDSLYSYNAVALRYSSGSKSLELDSFSMQPVLSREEHYRRHPVQETLYEISFASLVLGEFQLEEFIRRNRFVADTIGLISPRISAYMDRTQERMAESRIGSFPHQQLMRAGAGILIREFSIHDGRLEYREKDDDSYAEAVIRIDDIYVRGQHLTNLREEISRKNEITAQVSARLLDRTPLSGEFIFHAASPEGRFRFAGKTGRLSLAQLEPVTPLFSRIRIRSFDMRQLEFDLEGDDHGAVADVQMRYSNLALELNRKPGQAKQGRREFVTRMVNRYMIASSNPDQTGIERKASRVTVQRLTTQSFFGLIWRAVFTGMQHIFLRQGQLLSAVRRN